MTEKLTSITRMSDVAYTSGFATAIMGTWTWLGENATAIGAVCAIIGSVVCIVTYATNLYFKRKHFNLERRNKRGNYYE
jgi:hypothetical protein